MIYDYENKMVQVKVVYYGPAMSGKTTAIKSLSSYFNKEKEIESIESSAGRTLFFDCGALQFKGMEWDVKFLIHATTGQDIYAFTRPVTLNGADGIIFVGDSRKDCLDLNVRSWNELKVLLGEKMNEIPLVISLNKCDLDDSLKISEDEFLKSIEAKNFNIISLTKVVAIEGTGTLEIFKELIAKIFPSINLK